VRTYKRKRQCWGRNEARRLDTDERELHTSRTRNCALGYFREQHHPSMRVDTLELQLKIAGEVVEEFVHEDEVYVECNLMHSTATYEVPLAEGSNTEHVAMWYVLPLFAAPSCLVVHELKSQLPSTRARVS
jgi:hypothetical protein